MIDKFAMTGFWGARSCNKIRAAAFRSIGGVLLILMLPGSIALAASAGDALSSWRVAAVAARHLADNDAEAAYAEAQRLQQSLPGSALASDRAQMLNLMARVEINLGKTREPTLHADQALEIARQAGDSVGQLEAYLNLALAGIYEGDISRSVHATEAMSPLISKVDRPDLVAEAMLRSAMSYQRLLQLNEAVELTMRSLDIAERSNNPLALAYAHHGAGISFNQAGRSEESIKHYEAMLAAATKAGSIVLQGYALAGRANNHFDIGQTEEAIADYQSALKLFEQAKTPFNMNFAQFGLADIFRKLGRNQEALSLLNEVDARYQKYPSPVGEWFTLIARSRVHQLLNDMTSAQADALHAQQIADSTGFPYYRSESSRRRAELAATVGDFQDAYRLSGEADKLMAEADREKTSKYFLELTRNYQEEVRQRRIEELTRSNARQAALLAQQTLRQRWLATVLGASVLLLIGTALFITWQRRSHRLLRAANDQLQKSRMDLQHQTRVLQSILDSMADGVAVADAQGNYTLINAAARKIVGDGVTADAPDQWVKNYGLFMPDRVTPYATEELPLSRALRGESCDDVQIFMKNAAKPEGRWLQVHAQPLTGNGDGELGAVAVFSDITERKQAEEQIRSLNAELEQRVQSRTAELRQQARYLRTLIDMLPMWAWLKDTRSRYLAVNQANAEACGKTIDTMIGKSDPELFPPALASSFLADDTEVMATRQRKTVEESVYTATGQVWLETFKAPVLDEDGSLLGTVGVAQDISRRKAVEAAREAALAEAERLARLRSDFLAQMSHELRTPLNGILGYAQILLREKTLNTAQRDGLRVIQHSGEHLLTLINDILDLARIEAGKQELNLSDVLFREFLRVIGDIIRIKAEEKGLTFRQELATELPVAIKIDEKRLRQVLLNLLANAVRFTDYGEVCLRVSASSLTRLHFEVSDTGTGIEPMQLSAIFEPFVQFGEGGRRSTGTGLGLAISRQYVRLMGSDISVRSRPGEGSRFWFDLDVKLAHSAPQSAGAHGIVVGVEGPPRTLLVVDDNADNRRLLVDMLQPVGFKVEIAVSGEEAVEKAKTLLPDAILMDIVMPGIGGLEAIRLIRRQPGMKTRPIVAVSASTQGQDEAGSLAAGADMFLPKPVELNRLLINLVRMLGLTCIYEQVDEEGAPQQEQGAIQRLPPQEELIILQRLAREGDMRGSLQWADRVGDLDGQQFRSYANRVRTLAEQFQTKALVALVEQSIRSLITET